MVTFRDREGKPVWIFLTNRELEQRMKLLTETRGLKQTFEHLVRRLRELGLR